MEYYIMHSYRYKNARTGEDYIARSFHNGTMFGMMSFGPIHSAIKYPNKRAAQAVANSRRKDDIISVKDATETVLAKY